jgi:protein-S-isoprenylcysteine O-methyltransferase Ste14
MFVFVRAVSYASLFIGFVLVYAPDRILAWSGVVRPAATGAQQFMAMIMGALGAIIALWCVFTFATIGRGTPAPFDPPRRLVTSGPYRFVRNPMYLGAAFALGGAGLCHASAPLLGYASLFLLATHLFVVFYEEPTHRTGFGAHYEAYCRKVGRCHPRIAARSDEGAT